MRWCARHGRPRLLTLTRLVAVRAQISFANTWLALAAFFVVYDFFYAPFHRALHHRLVYAYVHKHHHRQVVPTRGNTDAINVHPFEFILGEYNHVLAVYLVSRFVMPIHAVACVLFLVAGGCLATLNHTRLDCSWLTLPFTTVPVFAVRAHDTHHAAFNYNYGQYIMLWDHVMGTYKAHPQDPQDGAPPPSEAGVAGAKGRTAAGTNGSGIAAAHKEKGG